MRFIFLFTFLLAAIGLSAQAENYRAFEWDIVRLGYASPAQNGLGGGLSVGTEIRYNATNNLSIGFRPEFAVFTSDFDNDFVDIGVAGSYSFIGDYYFQDETNIRPFVGMGLGYYGGASANVDVNNPDDTELEDFDGGNSFGISPRVGIELGHFRLSLEYNLAFNDNVSNYLGLQFAGTLFGGPRYR